MIVQEDWPQENSDFALSKMFAQFIAKEYSMPKPMENAEDGIVSAWAIIRTAVRPNTLISILELQTSVGFWIQKIEKFEMILIDWIM